jgi:hypothetical protein
MHRRRLGLNTKRAAKPRQAEKAPAWGARAEANIEPPDHVLADAQFRNALPEPMFGDPKPGQSALDKRQR